MATLRLFIAPGFSQALKLVAGTAALVVDSDTALSPVHSFVLRF